MESGWAQMNKDWHAQNRMPKNATMDQRVRWHEEHALACGCRPVPPTVRAAMDNRNQRVR
jgi:hypothetical protein